MLKKTASINSIYTPANTLAIQNVKVCFSARIVNRKLLNVKSGRTDEILLDFSESKRFGTNIQGELIFAANGEIIEPESISCSTLLPELPT